MNLCKDCKWWKRTKAPKQGIHMYGIHKLYKFAGRGPFVCLVCGESVSTYWLIEGHIKNQHKNELTKLQNTMVGFCSNNLTVYDDALSYSNEETPRGSLFYFDHEGYGANLWTDEEFGCINFEVVK